MKTSELRQLLAEAQAEIEVAKRVRSPAILYDGPDEARWALWRATAPALPALLDVVDAAQKLRRTRVGGFSSIAWQDGTEIEAALAALEES